MISKLRAQKIEIDLPKEDAEVWLHATLQRVLKDANYNTIQEMGIVAHLNRNAYRVAAETVDVVDPVTGQSMTVSGAGAHAIIKAFIHKWLIEEYGGSVNEHGDFIEKD